LKDLGNLHKHRFSAGDLQLAVVHLERWAAKPHSMAITVNVATGFLTVFGFEFDSEPGFRQKGLPAMRFRASRKAFHHSALCLLPVRLMIELGVSAEQAKLTFSCDSIAESY
jgi:hypothetical protein